ncbi:MAG: polyhydroxyalkanoate synthesis repressor PhaR [Rubrivivax sp.]|jgi:polyhydroxyalkanoate synthesis repressor PhaR|nr:polyhydroxyalkanoate synthesis repressor PhaR [Rubrivivax sp.]
MPSARSAPPAPAEPAGRTGVRTIKKYPNRRLYDTQTSSYITLADVKQMVLDADDFEVRDAKTGEDLTRSILLQIILEEESGGVPMFTAQMLAQIIRFYGHAAQGFMGAYLEKNLQAFVDFQNQLLAQGQGLVDPKHLTPDAWTQFVGAQAPLMQNLMSSYVENSRAMFEKMQEGLPFANPLFPGFPPRK